MKRKIAEKNCQSCAEFCYQIYDTLLLLLMLLSQFSFLQCRGNGNAILLVPHSVTHTLQPWIKLHCMLEHMLSKRTANQRLFAVKQTREGGREVERPSPCHNCAHIYFTFLLFRMAIKWKFKWQWHPKCNSHAITASKCITKFPNK